MNDEPTITELRQKLLLTPKEFGILIGASESSARKLIRRECIPTIDIYEGGGMRIPQPVAIAWIERKEQELRSKIRQLEDMVRMPATRQNGR